jgi:hypothetical protein
MSLDMLARYNTFCRRFLGSGPRPASAQERLALAFDVAKLSIPIGMLLSFFGFGITLQTIV